MLCAEIDFRTAAATGAKKKGGGRGFLVTHNSKRKIKIVCVTHPPQPRTSLGLPSPE